jgi:hypothetical protein
MNHLFCFGFGFSAQALAARLSPSNCLQTWQLTGTSTSAAGCERIRQAGHQAVLFDGAAPSADVSKALATATHVVVSAPPGEHGDPGLADVVSSTQAPP